MREKKRGEEERRRRTKRKQVWPTFNYDAALLLKGLDEILLGDPGGRTDEDLDIEVLALEDLEGDGPAEDPGAAEEEEVLGKAGHAGVQKKEKRGKG